MSNDDAADARRFRALVEIGKLYVEREEPGDWTCWLAIPCIPFRSQTTDPRELADKLAEFLIELKRRPTNPNEPR